MSDQKTEVTNDLPKAIDDLIGRKGGKNRLRVSVFKAEAAAMSSIRNKLANAYRSTDNPSTRRNLSSIAKASGMRRAPSGMPKGAAAEMTNEEIIGYRKGISSQPRYRVGLIRFKEKGSKNDPNNPWSWPFLEYGTKFQPARRILHNTFASNKGQALSRFMGAASAYIKGDIADIEAKAAMRAQKAAARAAKRAAIMEKRAAKEAKRAERIRAREERDQMRIRRQNERNAKKEQRYFNKQAKQAQMMAKRREREDARMQKLDQKMKKILQQRNGG